MKIYLSGPMKGYPDSNYPLFHEVTKQLRAEGHTVYNPAEFPHDGPLETFPFRKAFAEYCKFICEEADALMMLPGWQKSRGASCEHMLATNCGVEVLLWEEHNK
jgi:hypothetical protein